MHKSFRCLALLALFCTSQLVLSRALQGQSPHLASAEEDITETDPKRAAKMEQVLIQNARQLTFEGRRAGEGYFSQDGTQMVFQSERSPGNPFFQIYVMDLETGDVERVSPGNGKTTCAWIHPDGNRVLLASTQDDKDAVKKQKAEYDLRASGKERRYAWDYDEHFEVYEYDRKTKKYNNLTNVVGYDAEGSWSPDGKLVAFTSNRRAYDGSMDAEAAKQFKLDPAYMNDLFIMNADGSNVKQLTTSPGYDGGPFFSPDGKRICWRRFTPNGAIAEVWTMNIDGTDKRQITRLGAMSWAPFYHPSGKYLIFTTNLHKFSNFELYMVDAEGKSEPVRVTYTKGFDGLPVFTPDGKGLAWTTNRTKTKDSQIFVANWNHEAALAALGINESDQPAPSARREAKVSRENASADFESADMIRHVDYLCRDELAGRMTGTRGEKLATDYVAAYLESLGLTPAGDDGNWFQYFEFTAGVTLGSNNGLVAGDKEYKVDKDWRPLAFSSNGDVKAAPVVFAGYGIVAPQDEGQEEYDSYVHLDVKDKWVMVFRYLPENVNAERRQHLSRPSQPRFKAMLARDRGAKGLIIVSGPNSKAENQLVRLASDGSLAGTSIPVISVTDDVAADMLRQSGKSLQELQTKLDSGALMMGFELKSVKVGAAIDVRKIKRKGRNVLGRLQVGEKSAAQAVVVGAHIDHLGRGKSTSSLARADEREQIHYGADDNASGVAAMLEIAEYLADMKKRGKLDGKRDVIFAAWSGEELGLIGSNHFVKNYSVGHSHGHGHGHSHSHGHGAAHGDTSAKNPHANPHAKNPHANPHAKNPHANPHAKNPHANPHAKNPHANPHAKNPHANPHASGAKSPHGDQGSGQTAAKTNPHSPHAHSHDPHSLYPAIAACINMDMVGRLDKSLILQGIGSSSIWKSEVERRNAPVGLPITLQNDSYLPTDASSFYMRGVPILSAFTGSHSEYHTPRDKPATLNFEGAAKVARFMGLVTRSLVMRDDAPDYVEQTRPKEGQRKARLRAYLGTIPDYAEEVKGVKLGGATKNGPADKAGVKPGDVIVELAGKKIENIYDYTYAIEALKIGVKVKMVVLRNGKKVTLEVTPGSRD